MPPDIAGSAPGRTRVRRLASVCIQVCATCDNRPDAGPDRTAGQSLHAALVAACTGEPGLTVEAVPCLAVCERPVTIAFRAPGKWSYVIGDVDIARDLPDIVLAAHAVAAAPHGVPAMDRRPRFFRTGVICRLPPGEPQPHPPA